MNVFGHVQSGGEWALWGLALCPLPVTLIVRCLPPVRRRRAAGPVAQVSATLREMATSPEQVREYSEGLGRG
jgi:hypothetical protein